MKSLRALFKGKPIYVKSPTNATPMKLVQIVHHGKKTTGLLIRPASNILSFKKYYSIFCAEKERWEQISYFQYLKYRWKRSGLYEK